jgi:hypothetical protein
VEKWANGQCYFYSEKFSLDHKCMMCGGVFSIMTDDSGDDNDAITDEDLHISMHALTGVAPSDDIRIRVKIDNVELNTLVDSSSTIRSSMAALHTISRLASRRAQTYGSRSPTASACVALGFVFPHQSPSMVSSSLSTVMLWTCKGSTSLWVSLG